MMKTSGKLRTYKTQEYLDYVYATLINGLTGLKREFKRNFTKSEYKLKKFTGYQRSWGSHVNNYVIMCGVYENCRVEVIDESDGYLFPVGIRIYPSNVSRAYLSIGGDDPRRETGYGIISYGIIFEYEAESLDAVFSKFKRKQPTESETAFALDTVIDECLKIVCIK